MAQLGTSNNDLTAVQPHSITNFALQSQKTLFERVVNLANQTVTKVAGTNFHITKNASNHSMTPAYDVPHSDVAPKTGSTTQTTNNTMFEIDRNSVAATRQGGTRAHINTQGLGQYGTIDSDQQ